MNDFNVINKDTPSAMLEDCIRQWIEAGCSMRGDDLISPDRVAKCEIDCEQVGGVIKKRRIKIVWSCPYHHEHKFKWTAWPCCALRNALDVAGALMSRNDTE